MSDGGDGARPLLRGTRVLEAGPELAAAVCGRMFADLGAEVVRLDPPGAPFEDDSRALAELALHAGKRRSEIDLRSEHGREQFDALTAGADLVVVAGDPVQLRAIGLDAPRLRAASARAVVACITPFGLDGPYSDYLGGDLIAFHASGIARLLMGQVDDPAAEPPVRAAGEQSEFIAGVTASCAAMHALIGRQAGEPGELIDVSTQEALACMAVRELARPAFAQPPARRRREGTAAAPPSPSCGARRARRDLAARGPPVARLAGGDGRPAMGRRAALRRSRHPRRALGCAARADERVEREPDA